MMQQTKRPALPDDDAPLDNHLDEGEDGVLPEFPTQPFRFIPPTGRSPVPPRQSRPRVRGGLGVSIVSTSQGVMTGTHARKNNLGGELICYIW